MTEQVVALRLIRGFSPKEMQVLRDALDLAQAANFDIASCDINNKDMYADRAHAIGEIISFLKDKELIISERTK